MGTAPPPVTIGAGLPYDLTLKMPRAPSYDYTTTSRDSSLTMPSMVYDSILETTDNSLTMPSITYEYEVS
jgi:hypothetical protein